MIGYEQKPHDLIKKYFKIKETVVVVTIKPFY